MQVCYLSQAKSLFICSVNFDVYSHKITNITSTFESILRQDSMVEIPTPSSLAYQSVAVRFEENSYPLVDPVYVGDLEYTKKIGNLIIKTGDCILVGDQHSREHDIFIPPQEGIYTVWVRCYRQKSVGLNGFTIYSHELILLNIENESIDFNMKQDYSKGLGIIFRTGSLGFLLYNPYELKKYVKDVGAKKPLIDRFTETDDGEMLMRKGSLLPIIGIQSRTYRLILRTEADVITNEEWVGTNIISNRIYGLTVNPDNQLIIADADILLSWEPEQALFTNLLLTKGPKKAEVFGFVKASRRWKIPVLVTYEIVLSDVEQLPSKIDDPLINEDLFSLYLENNC